MGNVLKLLVFATLLGSRGSCMSIDHIDGTAVLMSVSDEMDQKFFAMVSSASNESNLNVWHSDSKQLVLPSDNRLETLSVLEAPRLDTLVLHPNTQLKQLVLRHCRLYGLAESLENLQALRLLKITLCRLNGTFNLAELLPLRNLTTFSLEGNGIREVMLQLDESSEEWKPASVLQILDLRYNKIEHFHLNVLGGFPALNQLLLQQNRIATLAGSVMLPKLQTFDVTQNLLTELDLSGCNCSALLHVYASDNALRTFPVFGDSITDIQVLKLDYNQLSAVDTRELKKLRNLTRLVLSNNVLKSFNAENGDETVAVELPSLKWLELFSNQIESLDLLGWKLPALETLRAMDNPLVTIRDDLFARYPQLTKVGCFCPDIDCEWIQRNVQLIRCGRIDMSLALEGQMQVGKGYRCVTVPYIGCVRCPFKRKERNVTKPVH